MLSMVLALVLCSPLSIRASNLAPSVHPGFSAVLRSRSLERFEPQVFQDGQARMYMALWSLLSMCIYILSLFLSLYLSPLSLSLSLSRTWSRFLGLHVDGHSSVRRLTDLRPRSVACEQGMPHIADLPSTGLDCVLRFY